MPYYDPVWNTWTTTVTNGTSTITQYQNLGYTNSVAWNTWNSSSITYTTTLRAAPEPEPETEEQRTAREAEYERILEDTRRRHVEQENRARSARVQARALLRSLVSQEQWNHWTEFSEIEIVGSEGTSFRLTPGSNGNITVFDENGDIERICAHPQLFDEFGAILPNEDVLAAQILALRTDEIGFRRIANVHRRYRAEVDELAA